MFDHFDVDAVTLCNSVYLHAIYLTTAKEKGGKNNSDVVNFTKNVSCVMLTVEYLKSLICTLKQYIQYTIGYRITMITTSMTKMGYTVCVMASMAN